jgi:hypothetical protein
LMTHLGLQDAPRKRRDGSQAPGAWSGCVLCTDQPGVFIYVSQEKWDKTKRLLIEVMDLIDDDFTKIPRKRLEQIRGFLQYVTRTYTGMNPYLIGFHLTIDGWRENQDDEGWRQKPRPTGFCGDEGISNEVAGMLAALKMTEEEAILMAQDSEAPAFVKGVPRFRNDIEALIRLSHSDSPHLSGASGVQNRDMLSMPSTMLPVGVLEQPHPDWRRPLLRVRTMEQRGLIRLFFQLARAG